MSVSRIYDPSVLEDPADFTLSIDISSTYDVPNADGSSPSASFKVVAPTLRVAMQGLSLLNGKSNPDSPLLDSLWQAAGDDLGFTDDISDEDLEASMPALIERFKDVSEWKEHKLELSLSDGSGSDSEFEVIMKAPSYEIIYGSFNAATSKQKLNALIANLMPIDDEDY